MRTYLLPPDLHDLMTLVDQLELNVWRLYVRSLGSEWGDGEGLPVGVGGVRRRRLGRVLRYGARVVNWG